MKDSLETFVRVPQNEKAFKAVESLNSGIPYNQHVIIMGPNRSGKSKLLRGIGEDAIQNGAEMMLFTCSGADIAMALQIDADDSFFERLGETPLLLIDDIDRLFTVEKGDQLLSLLIAERNKHQLVTVLASRDNVKEMDLPYSKDLLADFEIVEIAPLTKDDKVLFVELAQSLYTLEDSPEIPRETAQAIVDMFEMDFYQLENATRYLLTDEDCRELDIITPEKARDLLQ